MLVAVERAWDRQTLRALLEDDVELNVVGESGLDDAPGETCRLRPDLVLLDADLRTHAGRRALSALRAAAANVRVLLVTAVADPLVLVEALAAGASGVVVKTRAQERLLPAVHDVIAGRVPVDDELVAELRERLKRPAELPAGKAAVADIPLTARELTVLRLVAEGLTNDAIAANLVLSSGTVKLHVQHVIAKLGVANRTQAAVFAARKGLLEKD